MRAAFQFDQRGDRLAVAPSARQQRHRHRIDPAIRPEHQQGVDAAALKGVVQAITRLEGKAAGVHTVAEARAHPALLAHHHRHRLVHHLDFSHSLFLGLDQGAARVGKGLRVGLNFLDHQAAQRSRAVDDFFQLALLDAQLGELLLDLDGFQPRQLAQADLQDVFGLPVAQVKACNQRRLGLVALADDRDHFVDVQQNGLPTLQNVDAVQHLAQPVP